MFHKIAVLFVIGATALAGMRAPAALGADGKSSVLRPMLEGRAGFKLSVQGRDPHPAVSLLHRIEDRDEEEHYSRILWLPSGVEVLTISWNGFITAWNAETGNRVYHERPVGDLRLSDVVLVRDGSQALVVGEAGTILLINTRDGTVARRWQEPAGNWVTAVTVSQDGAFFATGNLQGDVAIWSTAEAAPLAQWRAHLWPINALALNFTPTGRFVYSADPSGVKLWNVDDGALVRALGDPSVGGQLDPERWWFSSLSFSIDRSYVIAGGYDSTRAIDLGSGETLRTYGELPMGVLAARIDEARSEVVAVVRDFTIRVFDAETAEPKPMLWVPVFLFSMMVDAAISPRGDFIAVASNDPNFARMGSFPVLKIYRYQP